MDLKVVVNSKKLFIAEEMHQRILTTNKRGQLFYFCFVIGILSMVLIFVASKYLSLNVSQLVSHCVKQIIEDPSEKIYKISTNYSNKCTVLLCNMYVRNGDIY